PVEIHTIPHVPWKDKAPPVPKSMAQKVIDYFNKRIEAGCHEFCNSPYSNRWWPVLKKNGSIRPICDGQRGNAVTIRDVGTMPYMEFQTEEIAGHSLMALFDFESY
ncbi:hypothetical protein BCR33DRAFT_642217, partial [Rhizoclosmatium globosum]